MRLRARLGLAARRAPDQAERARDRTTLLAYETLFRHGNPRVMSRAIWMVQRREQSSVRWSPRNPDLTATTGRLHTSVATIVRLMLAAPIESSQYLVYVPERDRPRCLASLAGTWIPASVGTAMTKPSLPRFGETLRLF